MTTKYRWKVYCSTENAWISTISVSKPTTCPTDIAHGIRDVRKIRKVYPNDYIVVNDDTTKTGRKTIRNNFWDDEKTSVIADDFIGSEFNTIWLHDIVGAASDTTLTNGVTGGCSRLTSGTNAADYAQLRIGNGPIMYSNRPYIKFRTKIDSITDTNVRFGGYYDNTNDVEFVYNVTGTPGNWYTKTSSGTSTSIDTGIVADTNWHIFEIVSCSDDVKFYIDGIVVSTHNTNLPINQLDIFIRQETVTTSRNLDVDYLMYHSDRVGSGEGSGERGGCVIM